MPDLKFYNAPGSSSLCPHILLLETGLSFSDIAMKVDAEHVLPDDFRLINPKMRVPVLSLDSQIITEVPAIATAISSLAPELYLMGRTPSESAKVYEWMCWLSGTLHGAGFTHLFRPGWFTKVASKEELEGIRKRAKEVVGECFEMIEGKLRKGEWAVGDRFTAVDADLLVFFRWGNQVGFEMRVTFPKYTMLMERLVKRDAVRRALDIEGIETTL